MCGFFITNSKDVTSNDESLIEKLLRFRGPDCSSGLVEHNGWKAYHSRLSIIDVQAGTNQPMIDLNGGMLVFNGEILNYRELGHKYFDIDFKGDTELLSALLSSNNLDISELDGFYSFVYIDKNGNLSHAARDSFGVKPLFFYETEDSISFCSEPIVLKQLFDLGTNKSAIQEYYATRAPIFSGSYFENVKSVDPGTCIITGKYFDCSDHLGGNYGEVRLDEIQEAITKGVDTRMVSEVPVGLLLSKGIDSNLLRSIGDFDKYYTTGFAGDDDLEFLRQERIPGLTVLEVNEEEYKIAFDYLLTLRGEPMSVPNEVLLYLVSKRAAEDGVKVLLSGEGADEFFGGYDRVFRWAATVDNFDLNQFLSYYCYTKPAEDSELFRTFEALFSKVTFDSPFEYVRWFFIRHHMPVLFRRLDFALMAAGIEGREPIANMHTFVKSIRLSPDSLMNENVGKKPLRDLILPFMGEEFAYDKKVGFPVDLTKIFDNENNLSSYELWFSENLKVINR
ncbi:asparagine synthetase B family protein [Vibrio sp. OPT20]|uniref:asparagine synthetase B family protein n=1 Tax=Vibrio sp. OPT20 TaxID=2778642 RepID=UPI0018800154|nr:asparagine synthetase B [Vibrio sp. OPT20]MBE8564354.1 asparagine synthetase B [Vibrio sp. OPT20]